MFCECFYNSIIISPFVRLLATFFFVKLHLFHVYVKSIDVLIRSCHILLQLTSFSRIRFLPLRSPNEVLQPIRLLSILIFIKVLIFLYIFAKIKLFFLSMNNFFRLLRFLRLLFNLLGFFRVDLLILRFVARSILVVHHFTHMIMQRL